MVTETITWVGWNNHRNHNFLEPEKEHKHVTQQKNRYLSQWASIFFFQGHPGIPESNAHNLTQTLEICWYSWKVTSQMQILYNKKK